MTTPTDFVRGFLAYSKRASEVDALSRLVLFSISFYADEIAGECEISISQLAKECGCSYRTIRSRLKKLEILGVIDIERSNCAPSIITLLGFKEWINSEYYSSTKEPLSMGRIA